MLLLLYITEYSGKLIARTVEAKDVIEAEKIVDKHYHNVHVVTPYSYTDCLSSAEDLT